MTSDADKRLKEAQQALAPSSRARMSGIYRKESKVPAKRVPGTIRRYPLANRNLSSGCRADLKFDFQWGE